MIAKAKGEINFDFRILIRYKWKIDARDRSKESFTSSSLIIASAWLAYPKGQGGKLMRVRRIFGLVALPCGPANPLAFTTIHNGS